MVRKDESSESILQCAYSEILKSCCLFLNSFSKMINFVGAFSENKIFLLDVASNNVTEAKFLPPTPLLNPHTRK